MHELQPLETDKPVSFVSVKLMCQLLICAGYLISAKLRSPTHVFYKLESHHGIVRDKQRIASNPCQVTESCIGNGSPVVGTVVRSSS